MGQESFLKRTELLLGTEDLARLASKKILLAGCGGVGGGLVVTLARMGIGGFVLADPGVFDLPDLNRQWGAFRSSLGRNKAEIYQEMIADINPQAAVRVVPQGVNADNLDGLIETVDLVVDGLDFALPLEFRLTFYRRAQELGRWVISSPIVGFGTLTLLGRPDGMPMGPLIEHFIGIAKTTSRLPTSFENHFFSAHVTAIERCIATGPIPTCAIAANLSAAVQASEIVLILLRDRHPEWRAPLALPRVLVAEPLGLKYQVLHFSELFPDYTSSCERS
jgi:hypothetical protein